MSGYAQDEAAAFDRSRVCFEALVAKPAGRACPNFCVTPYSV